MNKISHPIQDANCPRVFAGIAGIGSYFPKRAVTNKELEKLIDTTDEWIYTKIGIKKRHFSCSEHALSDLCIPAARKALKDAGVNAKDIDVVIVGAMSHDYNAAGLTGNIIKKALGADRAYAIDINIICAGFIYVTELGSSLIQSGKAKTVLAINGEIFSKYPHSRVTSVIFGDGAAAVVLKQTKTGYGIIDSYIMSTIDGAENLGIFAGGSRRIFSREVAESGEYVIEMNGRPIYDFATNAFQECVQAVLKKAGLKIEDVTYIFSHQANINIIKEGMQRLGIPMSRTLTNIHKYGNIGGGSVATVIDEARKKGLIKRGDLIVSVAFGSGLAAGANVMRWCGKEDIKNRP